MTADGKVTPLSALEELTQVPGQPQLQFPLGGATPIPGPTPRPGTTLHTAHTPGVRQTDLSLQQEGDRVRVVNLRSGIENGAECSVSHLWVVQEALAVDILLGPVHLLGGENLPGQLNL